MLEFRLLNPENADLCDFSRSQWYTAPVLAERIARWAIEPLRDMELCVLEPSAGRGALAIQLWDLHEVRLLKCVEIDPENARELERLGFQVTCSDFRAWEAPHRFDLAVMNPPFEDGAAEAHIIHALKSCDRVVAHVPLTTLEGQDRRSGLWSQAYLKRLVIHSSRPKYSGSRSGGQTAMCTIDVVRRPEGQPKNGRVAASGVEVEWWQ